MAEKTTESPLRFMSLAEAREAGVEFDEPKETRCEWCNAVLEPLGMIGLGGRFQWISSLECTCEGAKKAKEREEARVKAEEEKRRIDSFLQAGVKKRFLDAQIMNPVASGYLNSFSDAPGVGLYIAGPSRAGKTYLASALAKAFCLSGYRTILTTSLSMLDAIKASFDGDIKSGTSRYASADVLIIDDLGKENANSWVMTTLFQIVNERYEAMRPTIVTSQYMPEDLKRRMSRSGELESATAIVERLKETCRLLCLPRRKNVHLMEDVPRDA